MELQHSVVRYGSSETHAGAEAQECRGLWSTPAEWAPLSARPPPQSCRPERPASAGPRAASVIRAAGETPQPAWVTPVARRLAQNRELSERGGSGRRKARPRPFAPTVASLGGVGAVGAALQDAIEAV